MPDPRVPKTREELENLYAEQIIALKRRCDAYYSGDQFEARDIASILRTLLYDHGKSSKSLLGQIGRLETTRYLDSRVHGNLYLPSMKGAWPRTVLPYQLYANKDFFDFQVWWKEQRFTVIFNDVEFSREELVLEIANREGGAHVDPSSDRRIAGLNKTKFPWSSFNNSGWEEMRGFELATVCAIGEEVINSVTSEKNERITRLHNASAFSQFQHEDPQ